MIHLRYIGIRMGKYPEVIVWSFYDLADPYRYPFPHRPTR